MYGVQPVLEALKTPDRVARVLVARDRGATTHRIERAAKMAGVTVKVVPREALERRSLAGPSRHQGVMAELLEGTAQYQPFETLLAGLDGKARPLVVLLDGVQDPGNLGAILRSAYAMGADGVVLPQDRSAGLGPAAVKASAGAALHLPVAQVVNLKHALSPLTERGLWTAAAVMDGEAVGRVDLDRPLALVVGGEHKGVRPSLAGRCDVQISIPMEAGFGSLNASVAAGILLYECRRQQGRMAPKGGVDAGQKP